MYGDTLGDGLRRCGNADTTRTRVLVVGDSYTQAEHASDEQVYFAHLARDADVEVWAFGGSGYGTLQETMVLDDHVDRIRPDVIALQLTGNDLVNNGLALTRRSRIHNSGLRRPYLQPDGSVAYRIGRPFRWLREQLFRYSKLGYFLVSRYDMWQASTRHDEREALHQTLARTLVAGKRDPDLAHSLATTRILLRAFKHRAGHVPVVAFIADPVEPYHSLLGKLLDEQGIPWPASSPRGCVRRGQRATRR